VAANVYDDAAAWARRFLDGPQRALAAAKAGINAVVGLAAGQGGGDEGSPQSHYAAQHDEEFGNPR
jgi:hypothetical protein